jgi:hypothetical protein
VRLGACIAAVTTFMVWTAASASPQASDPGCTGSYGGAAPRTGPALRFGIDPGLAGSAGGAQLPAKPDDQAKDLASVEALATRGRVLVVRLNRLFWSDGERGIATFKREVGRYTRAGFEAELQVRYHPPSGMAGDIAAWLAYVRRVVDTFGPNPGVTSMTITNEVNINFSPNTSDGYYKGAEDALIAGVEAANAEALRRHFTQLRFGFTYAYRFPDDNSFFSYLGAHGGAPFQRALGFVGLDFYPGTIYPPAMAPGDSYRSELAQAAGVLRDCLAPMGRIGARVPIWITENGVPTGRLSDAQQAAALTQLVQAARDYSGTFGITDYRWFNLRDSTSSGPATLVGPTFASDGLLRDDYSQKPSFGAYHELIAQLGARVRPAARPRCPRARRGARRSCGPSTSPAPRSSRRRSVHSG